MIKIAIDAGHGVDTPGKRTPLFTDGTFMKENEFNRATAQYLEALLQKYGFLTLITAPELNDTSLKTRVERANNAKADFFISIHANASGSEWSNAEGIETFVYKTIDQASSTYKAAEDVQKNLIKMTNLKNRGVKKDDFYVIRETKMPAILVECGFMTNLEEAKLLKSDSFRKLCAEAICKGMCDFYNVAYGESEKKMTIEEAKKIIIEKTGFDENTMKYLDFYRYADSMIIRLAEAMK